EPATQASYRVIADHLRAASFLVADGVLPGNEGRGYVLRRIMRRAMRHAEILGAREPTMYRLVPTLVREMAQAYPELMRAEGLIGGDAAPDAGGARSLEGIGRRRHRDGLVRPARAGRRHGVSGLRDGDGGGHRDRPAARRRRGGEPRGRGERPGPGQPDAVLR